MRCTQWLLPPSARAESEGRAADLDEPLAQVAILLHGQLELCQEPSAALCRVTQTLVVNINEPPLKIC